MEGYQVLEVGERVMVDLSEPALRRVSKRRKVSEGVVRRVAGRFLASPGLTRITYEILTDRPLLESRVWVFSERPGFMPSQLTRLDGQEKSGAV